MTWDRPLGLRNTSRAAVSTMSPNQHGMECAPIGWTCCDPIGWKRWSGFEDCQDLGERRWWSDNLPDLGKGVEIPLCAGFSSLANISRFLSLWGTVLTTSSYSAWWLHICTPWRNIIKNTFTRRWHKYEKGRTRKKILHLVKANWSESSTGKAPHCCALPS